LCWLLGFAWFCGRSKENEDLGQLFTSSRHSWSEMGAWFEISYLFDGKLFLSKPNVILQKMCEKLWKSGEFYDSLDCWENNSELPWKSPWLFEVDEVISQRLRRFIKSGVNSWNPRSNLQKRECV
jgi:hypothetical protein